ncbi:MAG: hypothetical protein ACRDP5_28325 [Streptosporangiaceae bacterium]
MTGIPSRSLRYALALAVLAVLALACATWWPHIRDEFFVLLGSRNETGGWYGFNSGTAGAFYMSILPALALFYWHGTCHDHPMCLRWGKYPAAGGVFRLCRHHHPDLQGQRPRRDLIWRLHDEHKQART